MTAACSPPPLLTTLDIDPAHPVARRLLQLAEPRHFLLRRAPNDRETALSQVISVDEVRKMKSFFALSAADGGRRTAIIDAVDEMNPAAANALLKLLEEPPAERHPVPHRPPACTPSAHHPLPLPRAAPCPPSRPQDLADALTQAGGDIAPEDRTALAELSGGSVGEAFRLTNLDGLKLYAALTRLFATLPRLDRPQALALAELAGARGAAETFDLLVTLIDLFLARLARVGAIRPDPARSRPERGAPPPPPRPSPTTAARAWADLAADLSSPRPAWQGGQP